MAAFSSDHALYLNDWRDNLIEGVAPSDCEDDLRHAAGNELKKKGGSPRKFCAARSSSALAVNTLGPFRRNPENLILAGYDDFQNAWFERKCPNGLRTPVPPHLDFLAVRPNAVVAVESKFLEPFGSPKVAAFTEQYRVPFEGAEGRSAIAEAPWTAMFKSLREDPKQYKHLDAAQLVKHYLGLIHSYPAKTRVLVYLYWEPGNADDIEEVREHRKEAKEFAERVSGGDTRFQVLSYLALWREWENNSRWAGMAAHLARLRERYNFTVQIIGGT